LGFLRGSGSGNDSKKCEQRKKKNFVPWQGLVPNNKRDEGREPEGS